MLAPSFLWCPLSEAIRLRSDEVHVWRAYLDRNISYVQKMQKNLSADEQKRAGQFYFKKDRKHFIVARGLLRVVLSRYLDKEPSQLRFSYNRYGKPSLVGLSDEEKLNFNVSHSCGIVLYAVTRNRKIGIDIERIVEDFPFEEIAGRFFSKGENKELLEIEAGRPREHAFFSCWTRKEAYIKARGEGLSIPFDQFDVSLSSGEPVKLLNNRHNPQEVSRWSLLQILPAPGFMAALSVDGHDWQVKYWDLPNQ